MVVIALAIGSAATGVLAVALAVQGWREYVADRHDFERLIWVPLASEPLAG